MPEAHWRVRLAKAWYSGARWPRLLRPLAVLFRLAVGLRRVLYRRGVLRSRSFATPVVIVGNITVGGTGKTPVVIALAQSLATRGLRAGIVSRGYGALAGEFPRIVSKDSRVEDVGDEALLMFQRTGCPCIVDPDRPRAVAALLQANDVDVVLSDDGLQHYALGRSMEIVLYDADRGFGNGLLLPAGPLREPLSRLAEADFVLPRGHCAGGDGIAIHIGAACNLRSGETRDVTQLPGYPELAVVTGIAHPESFINSLDALGVRARARIFPDHHLFVAEDFAGLETTDILMTEKDAVKCRSLAGQRAWSVPIDAQLPENLVDAVAELAVAAPR